MIKPDVVIFRRLVDDDEINENEQLVDNTVALRSSLRKRMEERLCSMPASRAS